MSSEKVGRGDESLDTPGDTHVAHAQLVPSQPPPRVRRRCIKRRWGIFGPQPALILFLRRVWAEMQQSRKRPPEGAATPLTFRPEGCPRLKRRSSAGVNLCSGLYSLFDAKGTSLRRKSLPFQTRTRGSERSSDLPEFTQLASRKAGLTPQAVPSAPVLHKRFQGLNFRVEGVFLDTQES